MKKYLNLLCLSFALANSAHTKPPNAGYSAEKLNVLWIYIEDMNPSIGCYGDDTVATPNMDALAKDAVLFERSFVPAGVCSPTRSAIITGKMQTTIGAHNHNSAYNKDTPILLPPYLRGNTLPELFRKAGYNTFNSGKTHYNFTHDHRKLYTDLMNDKISPWKSLQDKKKPFFGQIQLPGGKEVFGGLKKLSDSEKVDPVLAGKTLPPYYPKDELILKHWAMHYDSINLTDQRVGKIMTALKVDGLLEKTVVFLFSDHGCYLPRHKQFCYEGSLRVPLIIRAPKSTKTGTGIRRKDLVSALDVSATSLSFAGIEIPDWYDSRDLFDKDYKRDFVIAAKDRMDFTIDRVRSVRTKDDWKYIRNYYPERPYMQLNYRHGRDYMNRFTQMFKDGEMTKDQARFFAKHRPEEELYNLAKDPFELNNLATVPARQTKLKELRTILNDWVKKTDDKGQYPEDEPNLRFTYNIWGDAKCINPEYDKFRSEKKSQK